MAQNGGYTSGLVSKTPTYGPITLESNNGLLNMRRHHCHGPHQRCQLWPPERTCMNLVDLKMLMD